MWNRKSKAETAAEAEAADTPFARAMEHAVTSALKGPKRLTRILTGVVTGLVICMGISVYVAYQAHYTAAGLRQDSITSCEEGNGTRALDQQIWDSFVTLLLKGNTNKVAAEEGAAFEKQVAIAYAPKNCQAEYANVGSDPSSPDALPGDEARTESVTSETAELLSWDGACLTVANANAGTAVTQASCSTAHAWTYYSTGELTPQGHSNVEVGDSGGHFVLKSVPTGTDIFTDDLKAGPAGYDYDELYFGVGGTYWHANGSGQQVTFDSSQGDHANYWAILSYTQGGKAPHQAVAFDVNGPGI